MSDSEFLNGESDVPIISRKARDKYNLATKKQKPSGPITMDRRDFLKAVAIAGVALPALSTIPGCASAISAVADKKNDDSNDLLAAPVSPEVISTQENFDIIEDNGTKGVVVEADDGKDALVQALVAGGSELLVFCGGTENYMLMEGVAKAEAMGWPHPKLVMGLHEAAGMGVAMGHAMVSRKPQALMVHVELGTQQTGGMLHNTWVGNIPMIFMAGRSSKTNLGELPGSKTGIQFIQEQYDQADIVRQYTKWDYEIGTALNIGHVIQRAYRVAKSPPAGPVYLPISREIMYQPLENATVYPEHYEPAIMGPGDPDALQQLAEWLVMAEHPVIFVRRMGRNPVAAAALQTLVEEMAIEVVDNRGYYNLPDPHWARSTNTRNSILNADVILHIDDNWPFGFLPFLPREDCKIASMDEDPVRLAQPLWGFSVDIPIQCDSSKAIPALLEAIEDAFQGNGTRRNAIRDRAETMQAAYASYLEGQAAAVAAASTQTPINTTWLGACVSEIVDEDTMVFNDLSRVTGQAPLSQPGHFFGGPASSLGWANAAAIGGKLAAPDKTAFALMGDGCFNFSVPTSVLWMARQYDTPFLTVINNNRAHMAVYSGLPGNYPGGACMTSGDFNGCEIDPPPEYAQTAESCGAYGEKVTDPAELPSALQRGLDWVHSGRCAVIDVVTEKPF